MFAAQLFAPGDECVDAIEGPSPLDVSLVVGGAVRPTL